LPTTAKKKKKKKKTRRILELLVVDITLSGQSGGRHQSQFS